MAKQSNAIPFREIISDIKKQKFSPVYILMGEEAYYIDKIVEQIEASAIPAQDRDFNLNVFYGNDADLDYVVASARQFPVMADRKLVILKEAQSMDKAKSALERLAPYISNPTMTTIFVMAYKGEIFPASSHLMKAAKSDDAVLFKSMLPKPHELLPLAKDYCASAKIPIDADAAQLLVDCIGGPLSKLFGEIDKVISIARTKGNRISLDIVEKNIGNSKDYSNFEFLDALATKDYAKGVKIINYYRNNPKTHPTVVLTSNIFTFFTNIIIAHYLPDKSDAAIMQTFSFKAPIQVRNVRTAMRNYSPIQAVNAIHYLRDFDRMSKGVQSYQNEFSLLAELLFKLFT